MQIKKIAIVLTLSLAFTTTTSLAATSQSAQGANSEKLAIMEEKIQDTTDAYIIDENGDTVELEIVDVEVRQLDNTASSNNAYSNVSQQNDIAAVSDEAVTYAATVKTTTKSGSYSKNGIDADGSLTMTWKDVSGTKNKITRLTGYWALGKGTFKKGEIFWGSDYTGPTFAPKSATVSKNFDKSISYTSTSSTGKLKAHSIAYIKSPKDGKQYQFSIMVSPTIFN